jgi:hypothetical protein
MQAFEQIFSKERIIKYLCTQRAKTAKNRSKYHILTTISKKEKYNYHSRTRIPDDSNEVCFLMPPRRSWVRLKKIDNGGVRLNSIDRNILIMRLTVKKHEKQDIRPEYFERLDKFINNIIKSINTKKFKFYPPKIKPERKDMHERTCRPISIFTLKDSLINCLTNKYLVNFFDKLFYDNSFAFRAVRLFDGQKSVPSHHDAFKKIINYLKENSENDIYVAECDMQKFYDTVNHKIVMKQFYRLCLMKLFKGEYEQDFSERICDKRARRIFVKYLQCYNFYNNVYKLNSDTDYFKKNHLSEWKFEWIKEKEIKARYKTEKNLKDVGIPQGGALSGLIANIVLNYADEMIMKLNDKDLLYVRYCDDMIMMHTSREKCKLALEKYEKALVDLKLFPHPKKEVKYSKDFWKEKTKGPYKWGFGKVDVPWVGFVGYEINRKGEIRVRKRSLKKEMDKQKDLVNDIIKAISNTNLKVSKDKVMASTYARLNGMAVGRVALWNYKNYENDMCWVKGFKLLNDNKYSRAQVKSLDKSKRKYLIELSKALNKIDDNDIKSKAKEISKNRENIYYGKPFSYFYQTIGRIRDDSIDSSITVSSGNNLCVESKQKQRPFQIPSKHSNMTSTNPQKPIIQPENKHMEMFKEDTPI